MNQTGFPFNVPGMPAWGDMATQAFNNPALEQGFTETWLKAFQAFQNLDLGGMAPPTGTADATPLRFANEKLMKIQQERARGLWSSGTRPCRTTCNWPTAASRATPGARTPWPPSPPRCTC